MFLSGGFGLSVVDHPRATQENHRQSRVQLISIGKSLAEFQHEIHGQDSHLNSKLMSSAAVMPAQMPKLFTQTFRIDSFEIFETFESFDDSKLNFNCEFTHKKVRRDLQIKWNLFPVFLVQKCRLQENFLFASSEIKNSIHFCREKKNDEHTNTARWLECQR